MRRKFFYILIGVLSITGCASSHKSSPQQLDSQPDTVMTLGDVYMQAGNYPQAEDFYRKAYQLMPQNEKPLIGLADVLVLGGKYPEAVVTYRQALKLKPNNKELHYKLAKLYIVSGNMIAALRELNILLIHNNHDYHALNGLGVVLDSVSEHHVAQICYKQGLKYASDDSLLLNNMGLSVAVTGDFSLAEYYFKKSIKSNSSSRAKNNLALIDEYNTEIKAENNEEEKNRLGEKLKNELSELINNNSKDVRSPAEVKKNAALLAAHWCSHQSLPRPFHGDF